MANPSWWVSPTNSTTSNSDHDYEKPVTYIKRNNPNLGPIPYQVLNGGAAWAGVILGAIAASVRNIICYGDWEKFWMVCFFAGLVIGTSKLADWMEAREKAREELFMKKLKAIHASGKCITDGTWQGSVDDWVL